MKIWDTITKGAKVAEIFLAKNSPTILTAVGISGMVAAVFLAVREPAKVEEELYDLEREEFNGNDIPIKHPILPRVKIYAKHYWPTALVMVASGTCLIFANHINLRREAALLTALELSKGNLKDIKDKIVQTDGEKKLQKIHDDIANDKLASMGDRAPLEDGGINYWILDEPSGHQFWGNITMVDTAVNEVNKQLFRSNSATWNDFHEELINAGARFDCSDRDIITEVGNMLGWTMDTTDQLLSVVKTYGADKFGRPRCVITYDLFEFPSWRG